MHVLYSLGEHIVTPMVCKHFPSMVKWRVSIMEPHSLRLVCLYHNSNFISSAGGAEVWFVRKITHTDEMHS